MKITPLDPKLVAQTTVTERKAPTASGSSTAEPSAQVALSASASMLSRLDADPTFDSAKVDRIAQAIRGGQFSVNPEAIADKLISNAEELLGRSFA